MTIFEYALTVLGIVLALAMANLFSGLAVTIKYSTKSGWFWVHTAWTTIILVTIVGFFWGLWRVWSHREVLVISEFLIGPFLSAGFYYITSRILLPEFVPGEFPDLRDHFNSIQRSFFAALGGLQISLYVTLPLVVGYSSSWIETALGYVLIVVAFLGLACKTHLQQQILVIAFALVFLFQEALQPAISR